MPIDYEYIDKWLNLEASKIIKNIITSFSSCLTPEILKSLPQNLDKFIVVNKPTKEDVERFSKEDGVKDPTEYSIEHVPSAHGGRAKNDGLIHIYPYSKSFENCQNNDEIISSCLNDIITHEIFHYFIRPDINIQNDPIKEDFSHYITEGLVQLYAEEYQLSQGKNKPYSNYDKNVETAKQLIAGLPDTIKKDFTKLHQFIFSCSIDSLLANSKNGKDIFEKYSFNSNIRTKINNIVKETISQLGITDENEIKGIIKHFKKLDINQAISEISAQLTQIQNIELQTRLNEIKDSITARQKGSLPAVHEKSFIPLMNQEYLNSLGLSPRQITNLEELSKRAINENLYTNPPDFQHDLKHVERVMLYAQLIANKMQKQGLNVNENKLLMAALYHDIGKTIGASNKEHGKVGMLEFKKKMQGKIDNVTLEQLSLIIGNHSEENNKLDFQNTNLNLEEQEEAQLLCNILKDADALDRNRLNYPPPIGNCDINYLRTDAAKEILPLTDNLLLEYQKAQVRDKERETGQNIFNDYDKLNNWLENYMSGKQDYIYHASLTPAIEELQPKESTQAGSYVYGDVDPIKCSMMAAFRLSLLIDRSGSKHELTEVFPNAIDTAINNKLITLYRLPKEEFQPYKETVTSAPNGEWVSKNSVKPVEEVTMPAAEYFKYLENNHLIKVDYDHSEKRQMSGILDSMNMYLWGLKNNDNMQNANNKYQQMLATVKYYAPDKVFAVGNIKAKADEIIDKHLKEWQSNNISVNFNDEKNFLAPIVNEYNDYKHQQKEELFKQEKKEKETGNKKYQLKDAKDYRSKKQNLLNIKKNLLMQKQQSLSNKTGVTYKRTMNGFINILLPIIVVCAIIMGGIILGISLV